MKIREWKEAIGFEELELETSYSLLFSNDWHWAANKCEVKKGLIRRLIERNQLSKIVDLAKQNLELLDLLIATIIDSNSLTNSDKELLVEFLCGMYNVQDNAESSNRKDNGGRREFILQGIESLIK